MNKDCWFGWVCMVLPNTCLFNVQPGGKINDGLCTFFLAGLAGDGGSRRQASDALAIYLESFVNAGQGGGTPDPAEIAAAQTKVSGKQREAVELLALNVLTVVVGRADYPVGHAHRRGHIHLPQPETHADGTRSFAVETARLERLDESDVAVLQLISDAVAAYLIEPDVDQLAAKLATMKRVAPNYTGHGNCQYPHPSHHKFDFADNFDCVAKEILHVLRPLEEAVRSAQEKAEQK